MKMNCLFMFLALNCFTRYWNINSSGTILKIGSSFPKNIGSSSILTSSLRDYKLCKKHIVFVYLLAHLIWSLALTSIHIVCSLLKLCYVIFKYHPPQKEFSSFTCRKQANKTLHILFLLVSYLYDVVVASVNWIILVVRK